MNITACLTNFQSNAPRYHSPSAFSGLKQNYDTFVMDFTSFDYCIASDDVVRYPFTLTMLMYMEGSVGKL